MCLMKVDIKLDENCKVCVWCEYMIKRKKERYTSEARCEAIGRAREVSEERNARLRKGASTHTK